MLLSSFFKKKGELVLIDCGKVEYAAYRVNGVPSLVQGEHVCHYIQWQWDGTREYVSVDRIRNNDWHCRRQQRAPERLVPEDSKPAAAAAAKPAAAVRHLVKSNIKPEAPTTATKTMKLEKQTTTAVVAVAACNRNPNNNNIIKQEAPVKAKKTVKSKLEKKTTAVIVEKGKKAPTTKRMEKATCVTTGWADPIIQRTHQPGIVYDRPATIHDSITDGNDMYVVTGFSCFNHPVYQHIPDLLEVKHAVTTKRSYMELSSCRVDPVQGQRIRVAAKREKGSQ